MDPRNATAARSTSKPLVAVRASGLATFDGASGATAFCPRCRREVIAPIGLERTVGRCSCGTTFETDAAAVAPTIPG
jgi:hypothetical protein